MCNPALYDKITSATMVDSCHGPKEYLASINLESEQLQKFDRPKENRSKYTNRNRVLDWLLGICLCWGKFFFYENWKSQLIRWKKRKELTLPSVVLRNGESQQGLSRRFRKKVIRSKILSEVRKRRWFVSRTEQRRQEKKKAIRRASQRRRFGDSYKS